MLQCSIVCGSIMNHRIVYIKKIIIEMWACGAVGLAANSNAVVSVDEQH
jgi:hypothetical protein